LPSNEKRTEDLTGLLFYRGATLARMVKKSNNVNAASSIGDENMLGITKYQPAQIEICNYTNDTVCTI